MHLQFKNKKTICDLLDKYIVRDVIYIICQYYVNNNILDNESIETLCPLLSIDTSKIKWTNDDWFHKTQSPYKHEIYKIINNIPTIMHRKFTNAIIKQDDRIIHVDDDNIVTLTGTIIKVYEYCKSEEFYDCIISTQFYDTGVIDSHVIFRKNKGYILILGESSIHMIPYDSKLKYHDSRLIRSNIENMAIKNESIIFCEHNKIFELDNDLKLSTIHTLPQNIEEYKKHIILNGNDIILIWRMRWSFYKGWFTGNVFTEKRIDFDLVENRDYVFFGNSFLRYNTLTTKNYICGNCNKYDNCNSGVYDLANEKIIYCSDKMLCTYSENMRYIMYSAFKHPHINPDTITYIIH